jgi:hypothetical protein
VSATSIAGVLVYIVATAAIRPRIPLQRTRCRRVSQ